MKIAPYLFLNITKQELNKETDMTTTEIINFTKEQQSIYYQKQLLEANEAIEQLGKIVSQQAAVIVEKDVVINSLIESIENAEQE